MRLLNKIILLLIFIVFFAAGFIFRESSKIKMPAKELPVPVMPPVAGPQTKPEPKYKNLKELVLDPPRSVGVLPAIRIQDCFQEVRENCGNGRVDVDETFFNCPQDCGIRLEPSAGIEQYYSVKPEEMLVIVFSRGSNEECVNTNPSLEIWEQTGNSSSLNQEYLLLDYVSRNFITGYTPLVKNIKVKVKGCFKSEIFAMTSLESPPVEAKYTAYHNSKYGFSLDAISGCRIEEHDWELNRLSSNPELVWQASFFHDSYGKTVLGDDVQPVIELSIEEFSEKEIFEAVKNSKVPCGMPLGGICKKFSPCDFSFSFLRYESQGVLGGLLNIGYSGKRMRGMVFVKGNRLYKILFLYSLPQHRVFNTKQIESMLRSISFEE